MSPSISCEIFERGSAVSGYAFDRFGCFLDELRLDEEKELLIFRR